MSINIVRGSDFTLSDGPELQDCLPGLAERGTPPADYWPGIEDDFE
jgi:hypothetical protein